MPQRGIDTGVWNHPDFQDLSPEAKLLALYLFTCPRGNQAGLFYLTLKSIADDTGLSKSEITGYFQELIPMDIGYYPDIKIVWVQNFLKHQAHSPKYLTAVAKCLTSIPYPDLIRQFLDYNDTISIPYQYPTDTLSIPPARVSGSVSVSVSVSETESEEPPISPLKRGTDLPRRKRDRETLKRNSPETYFKAGSLGHHVQT